MPGLTLTFFALAAAAHAAIAIGNCLCSGNDDDPIRDPNYSSSSYDRRTIVIQTQPSDTPPPRPPSYTYRPSETYTRTTPRTPAPPDSGRGGYHSSVVSPYARTPSQAQPSSTSSTRPTIAQHASTRPHVPPCVPTERDPLLSTAIRGVSHSNVDLPYNRTPCQTQPSSTHIWPSSTLTQPSSTNAHLSSATAQPSIRVVRLASTSSHVPSCVPTKREPLPPTVIQVISPDLRSDEPPTDTVENLDFAKKLRERARRRGDEMSEARKRAKSARKKRYGGGSQAHIREAIVHEKAMNELNKRAAKIIFTENNKNRKEGTVDLHGLYVPEAIQIAKDQVPAAISRGDEVVRFIVGKGLHSNAGEAKIRPALEGYFTKRGLKHSLGPKNSGVLIVRLD